MDDNTTNVGTHHNRQNVIFRKKKEGAVTVSLISPGLTTSSSPAPQEIRMSLLSDPAAIDVRDDRGQTAAHLVAWYGHAEVRRNYCLA